MDISICLFIIYYLTNIVMSEHKENNRSFRREEIVFNCSLWKINDVVFLDYRFFL